MTGPGLYSVGSWEAIDPPELLKVLSSLRVWSQIGFGQLSSREQSPGNDLRACYFISACGRVSKVMDDLCKFTAYFLLIAFSNT